MCGVGAHSAEQYVQVGNVWRIFNHCNKRLAIFPSLTKLSLDGNNLFIPDQGEFGK